MTAWMKPSLGVAPALTLSHPKMGRETFPPANQGE